MRPHEPELRDLQETTEKLGDGHATAVHVPEAAEEHLKITPLHQSKDSLLVDIID